MGLETAEVIEPHQIEQVQGCPEAITPPAVTGSSRYIPAIERIAPKLTSCAEIVGGNTRYHAWSALLIQTKQLRMSPYISAVVSDVDWDVAHYAYSTTTAVNS